MLHFARRLLQVGDPGARYWHNAKLETSCWKDPRNCGSIHEARTQAKSLGPFETPSTACKAAGRLPWTETWPTCSFMLRPRASSTP